MTGKIKLVHSGGNSVSLAVPTSNPSSSEVEFKLPQSDGSANEFLKTDGSGNLSFAAESAGITMADQWRITTAYTNSGTNFITANWERVDNSIFGQLGTGMTESSGVFTFPSTGIYFVNFFTTHRQVNGTSMYNGIQFHTTTDNSSYTMLANAYDSVAATAYFAVTALSHIVDITNTSTHKIKFAHVAEYSSNIAGDTNETMTGVTFIRLGDT